MKDTLKQCLIDSPMYDGAIRVLFVDDEPAILKALQRLSRRMGWQVEACSDGQEALHIAEEQEFDVFVSDMRMPSMQGDEVLAKLREIQPNVGRILLTGFADIQAIESAINKAKISNYANKPWDEKSFVSQIEATAQESRKKEQEHHNAICSKHNNKKLSKLALLLDKRIKEKNTEVTQALGLIENLQERSTKQYLQSMEVITQLMESKEGNDSSYSHFVTKFGERVLKELEWSEAGMQDFKLAAMFHRIGMFYLAENLVNRPIYALSSAERKDFEQYPLYGENALLGADSLKSIAMVVRHHREHVDGSGTPDRLTENEIPLFSRVLAVVSDFYDVYTGNLERALKGKQDAIEYLNQWRDRKYSSAVVDAFLKVLEKYDDLVSPVFQVSASELSTEMQLEQDISTSSGSVLLKKGAPITEEQIAHLKDYEKRNSVKFIISVSEG